MPIFAPINGFMLSQKPDARDGLAIMIVDDAEIILKIFLFMILFLCLVVKLNRNRKSGWRLRTIILGK